MKRNLLMTSTFLVSSLVYLFAICAWISVESFSHLIERWSHNSEMTVYLRPDAKEEEIKKLTDLFQQYSDRAEAVFQSSEAIQASLKRLMPKSDMDFAGNDELIAAIPPHFVIKGTSNLLGDSLFEVFQKITNDIGKNPVVESTSYGKSWADKYTSLLKSGRGATIAFIFALSLTFILVIGNSIRSHINSQREEIEILELVGATPSHIRKPFLIEGTLLSTIAMVMALVIVGLISYVIKNSNFEIIHVLDLKSLVWQPTYFDFFMAIFLSSAIGFFGSYFCLSEINTGWAASGKGKSLFNLFSLSKGFGRSANG